MARTTEKTDPNDHPKVIAFPPLIFGVFIVAGYALSAVLPGFLPPAGTGWLTALGALLIGGALIIAFSGIYHFKKAGTHVEPFKPTLTIVTKGPYRFTRNPMYLGLILMLAGAGVIFSLDWALVMAVPLALVLHWGVVLREEAYLTAKFGAAYTDYLAMTRRWV